MKDIRINTIADGDVNQTVFACDWHSWLCPFRSQRVKAFTLTSAQNYGKYLIHIWHSVILSTRLVSRVLHRYEEKQ